MIQSVLYIEMKLYYIKIRFNGVLQNNLKAITYKTDKEKVCPRLFSDRPTSPSPRNPPLTSPSRTTWYLMFII